MNMRTKAGFQLFGAWCAVAFIVILLVFWGLIGGFIPPHAPSATPETVAAIYQGNTQSIRVANLAVMFGALVFIPFAAAISDSVRRIEGGTGFLTIITLFGGVGTMVLIFYPGAWWLTAAYRPERDPVLLQLLNDIAWLQFVGGVSMYLALPAAFGAAILYDTRQEPAHPRWAGYASLWLMVLVIPDQLLFFFHDGPFAWDGLFGFWLPLGGFGGWFLLAAWCLRREALVQLNAKRTSNLN